MQPTAVQSLVWFLENFQSSVRRRHTELLLLRQLSTSEGRQVAELRPQSNLLIQKTTDVEGDRAGECSDSIDNDEDGFTDCDDQDCTDSEECADAPIDTGDPDPDDVDDDGDGFTENEGDCNDADGSIYPGAAETANGTDDNCDGVIDEGTAVYDDDGGDLINGCMGLSLAFPALADACPLNHRRRPHQKSQYLLSRAGLGPSPGQ